MELSCHLGASSLPRVRLRSNTPLRQRRSISGDRSHDSEPASLDELNALLAHYLAAGMESAPPSGALEQAQFLVYDAWEAPSPRRRAALAHQALELSPDCADAYLLLADDAETIAESKSLLADAIAAGARAIGAELEQLVANSSMWLAIETRPYLRALDALASLEWETGDRQAALARGWELLRLNPNDNQGIRYVQLHRLLVAGTLEDIDRMLASYADESSAAWVFSRALHLYRSRGAGPDADAALRVAKRANRHVVPYLLGERALPDELPEYIGFGDETEAAAYVSEALMVWVDTPAALEWLASTRGTSRAKKGRAPRQR